MTIGDGSVLICGLGALGQACLERLLPFDVSLRAVDVHPPHWRREELAQRIQLLVQGDMRQAQVLERAGIRQCRAVLLLSADSQVNLEAALLVRVLNPDADVVVRSSSGQAALGQLLEQRLPNIAVVDPVVLTAGAVASAIHPQEGLIQLETDGQGHSISVVNSPEPAAAPPARAGAFPLDHRSPARAQWPVHQGGNSAACGPSPQWVEALLARPTPAAAELAVCGLAGRDRHPFGAVL